MSWGDVSVELTTETENEMIEEALAVPRVGSAAHHHQGAVQRDRPPRPSPASRRSGVKTNVTCLMAMNQAYLAALAGATYVSIFSGRVRDMGYNVRPVIESTRAILDREGLASKIIVGSMRHMMDVNEALECGAHVPTVTPPILRKMVWNPRTIETINEFNTAWRSPAEEEVTERAA